ncbi:glycoside hydrolase family 75 protein [Aspergillus mulundensis]|uniref:Endo-chitosanase n=1 Tax=Aspergillus mulundensis TaxID=1810919 RepID=A0A3D8T2Z6_9EURO|nr:Endo-chitosanase [Aspergillus mulundensis]RDW92923.1 Endo-chitosanase [Aspergillus mulundensis]
MYPSSCLRHLAAAFFSASVLAQNGGANFNRPNGGPPANYFKAAPTMPVAALQSAASGLSRTARGGSFRISSDSSQRSPIYSDWASFNDGAAVVWTADMDVDCDGIDFRCRGNSDGLPETSWGALAAYEVPFIVIPEQYQEAHEAAIPGNNIAAVICNGKMFYGILGDTNGDSPEVTGEASWLMARTCFPNEGLSGAAGHSDQDVTYILFLGPNAVLPGTAMNDNYITDFGALRSMGDKLVNSLVRNIGLGGGDGSNTVTRPRTRTRPPTMKAMIPVATGRDTPLPRTLPDWITGQKQVEPGAASSGAASSSAASPSVASSGAASSSAASPSAASTRSATPGASSSGAASPSIASPGSSSSPAASSSSAPSVGSGSGAAPNISPSDLAAASGASPIGLSSSPAPASSASSPPLSSAIVGTPASVLPSNAAGPSSAIPSAASPSSASASSAAASSVVSPPIVNPPNAAVPPSAAVPPTSAATPPAAVTGSAASPGSSSPATTGPSCSWPGHCIGAPCSTLDDCADDLICASGTCAVDRELETTSPGASISAPSASILAKRQASSTPTPTPTPTCSWPGHCLGAPCSTEDDCSDDLTCSSGVCAVDNELESTGTPSSTGIALLRRQASSAPTPTPSCSWPGHCLGAPCSTEDDCSDDLTCISGACAVDNDLETEPTGTPSSTGFTMARRQASPSASAAPSCSWPGHCLGSSCSTDDDCSDDLMCASGVCAVEQDDDDSDPTESPSPTGSMSIMAKRVVTSSPSPTPSCSWAGRCLGAPCSTLDDCADDLVCVSGKCAVDRELDGSSITVSPTSRSMTKSWITAVRRWE